MRVVSFEDYVKMPRPNVTWLVEGLIPKPGIVMLLGEAKAGKSFLALDIALRVARGEKVLGCASTKSKVLYLNLDMAETEVRQRGTDLIASGVDIHAPLLELVHPEDEVRPINVLTPGGYNWLLQAVKASDAELIVVDVLREIHQEEENDSTAMKRVFDALEGAFRHRAVLYVHHTKKFPADMVGDPNPVTSGRGSSYISGRVHAFWLLHNRKLQMVSRSSETRVLNARRQPSGMWEFPDLEEATAQANILKLCSENPTESHHTLAKVALDKYGLSRSAYYRALGQVRCAHRGSLSPVEPPAQPETVAPCNSEVLSSPRPQLQAA
jgi:archaellum biogenesis ATPase FlaH